jgi:hypothetical protein
MTKIINSKRKGIFPIWPFTAARRVCLENLKIRI